MHAIKCLLPTLMLFCLMDYIWLGVVGKGLYLENVGSMLLVHQQTISPRLLPAAFVYLLFAIMLWLIVLPLAQSNIKMSFAYGALVGFVIYGIYDMTNLAVFKDWTTTIAIIDWCWGTFLCSVTGGFCALMNAIFK